MPSRQEPQQQEPLDFAEKAIAHRFSSGYDPIYKKGPYFEAFPGASVPALSSQRMSGDLGECVFGDALWGNVGASRFSLMEVAEPGQQGTYREHIDVALPHIKSLASEQRSDVFFKDGMTVMFGEKEYLSKKGFQELWKIIPPEAQIKLIQQSVYTLTESYASQCQRSFCSTNELSSNVSADDLLSGRATINDVKMKPRQELLDSLNARSGPAFAFMTGARNHVLNQGNNIDAVLETLMALKDVTTDGRVKTYIDAVQEFYANRVRVCETIEKSSVEHAISANPKLVTQLLKPSIIAKHKGIDEDSVNVREDGVIEYTTSQDDTKTYYAEGFFKGYHLKLSSATPFRLSLQDNHIKVAGISWDGTAGETPLHSIVNVIATDVSLQRDAIKFTLQKSETNPYILIRSNASVDEHQKSKQEFKNEMFKLEQLQKEASTEKYYDWKIIEWFTGKNAATRRQDAIGRIQGLRVELEKRRLQQKRMRDNSFNYIQSGNVFDITSGASGAVRKQIDLKPIATRVSKLKV